MLLLLRSQLMLALALLLLAWPAAAAPVTMPYANDFSSGAGSLTPAGTWSATGGAYRCTISASTATGSASVQATQLGGNPQTAAGFFLSGTFTVVSNANTGNTVGLAVLGTDANFSGGVNQPYYLIDLKPPLNSIRVVRVGINNTLFIPDTTLQTMTLNAAQPFTLEVLGTYENGVLRMDVTVRQGAASERVIAVDSEPLTGGFFGFRHRTNGGALTVDSDDFLLRRIATVSFTATPAPFARPGAPYNSPVGATSSTGAATTLTVPVRPAWLNYVPSAGASGTLGGTPSVAHFGSHTVTLAATDTESGAASQTFHVSVLEPTGVFISEFLAENESGLKDEDDDQEDWVEIFNPDASPVNVGGWWLSDDPLLPKKWAIPAGVTIPAQGFLVVFASGKDRAVDPAHLHTSFKLSNSAGSHLSLARADGTVVSSYPTYSAQRADRSYGTYGSYTPRGYLLNPTPGAPNEPVGYEGFVADTQFSVDRGFYTTPQNVEITCTTPGATLVYTLNGSTPTLTNGTQGASPITLKVASSTTLRVAAFAPGLAPSGPDTQTYLFLEDIRTQSASGAAPPGWPTGPVNGQILDYGMDPQVTSTATAQQMKNALSALPTLSLVTDLPNLFAQDGGIYVNPYGREEGFECPVSVELLHGDNSPGFHINAGLRIRGGASREGTNPKHNFHLYFRGEYGASKLKYPLFGEEGVDEFDRVDLRTTQVTSWHKDGSTSATYNRDEWNRSTHAAMGQPYTRSRYYHLYINGQYWGIYGTQERTDSAFSSSYFGGKKSDYDVMKTYVIPHRVEAADGDNAAWTQLFNAAVTGFATDAAYDAVQGLDATGQPSGTPPLLDVDSLIDYTLLRYYAGDTDAPINTGVPVPKNFYAIRPKDGRFGFRFFTHDAESTMSGGDVTGNTTVGNTLLYFNPRWLSQQLAANAKYRLRFADRVQKHLYHGGALDNPVALARWQGLRAQLSTAILAESARWGDAKSGTPRTVANWNSANDSIQSGFLATRRATLITQLRSRSLFPSFDAPSFNQHGGLVAAGFSLTISAPAGTTIFYTLDGTDPMSASAATYGGPVILNQPQVTVKTRARLNTTSEWSALTEALFTLNAIPAAAGKVAISEIHYNPPGPDDDTEFVELVNISGSRVDLTGASFTGAMIFTFGNVILEPGARICVVENSAAFATAYGGAVTMAGQWSGALNNSGDTIILRDKQGTEIERVTYGTAGAWPESADGEGFSLVRLSTATPAEASANWRSSSASGGNPGNTDTVAFASWLLARGYAEPMDDTDGNGTPALVEFATGMDLSGARAPKLSLTPEPGSNPPTAIAEYRRRIAGDEVVLDLQVAGNLAIAWQTLTPGGVAAPMVSRVSHADGTETVRLRVETEEQGFVRLRVRLP